MTIDELAAPIAQVDYDLESFVSLAITDPSARAAIVDLLAHHPHIMVYDHCFYIVSRACEERPELFYPSWPVFAGLLGHANSYHRNYGLAILACLTGADTDNRFPDVYEAYFEALHDRKFETAWYCVKGARIILRNRPEYRDDILGRLLEVDRLCPYPQKQLGLLKFWVLEALEQEYAALPDRASAQAFIRDAAGCVSPKTRKKARELVKTFGIPLP